MISSSTEVTAVAALSAWDLEDLGGGGGSGVPVDHADLEAQREEELENAYRRGRIEGEQAAQARARREVEAAVSAARGAHQQLRELGETWRQRLEEHLYALATAVARQIIERELEGDAESFRALVRKAATTFPMDQTLKVRLNPTDLDLLVDAGSVPPVDATDGREARWIADDEMVRGGCIVEGPDRIMDGRVDAALERIYWELTHG